MTRAPARRIEAAEGFTELAEQLALRTKATRVTGLRGAARAALVAELARAHGARPLLVVVPTAKDGDAFLEDLRAALGERAGEGRLRAFPRYDTQPYERFSPQPFLVAQRMDVLYRWLASPAPAPAAGNGSGARGEPAPIVVAPWTALAPRVPTREFVRSKSVHLEVGRIVDRDALVATLVAAGYARMPLVEERGELAVRGGILDLFPPQRALPVRIELLGDEVESIREFDPASQRSQASLPYMVAPPPRELLVERSLLVERQALLRELAADRGLAARDVDALVDTLLRGSVPPGGEALAPLLLRGMETVFEFLPEDTQVVVDDLGAGRARLLRYAEEALSNYELARESGRLVATPDELALSPEVLEQALLARRPLLLERLDALQGDGIASTRIPCESQEELRRQLTKARAGEQALAPLAAQIAAWREARYRVVLATPSLSHAERLRALLAEYRIESRATADPRAVWRWSSPGRVEVRATPLSEGFVLPQARLAVVTEEEIFGPREKTRRRAQAWPAGAAIDALAQLSSGDYLVHAEHGIGIYRGLVDLNLRGVAGEFLRIEYAEEARLFVPVHRLNLVSRYAGSDGHVPRIDKLGGVTWEKARRGVRRALRDMAKELLAVHAAREVAQGFAFSPRDRLFEEFEATFPYEETPDQLAAIEDVLADMQREKPMDRIVCGDVGYGKTEVAVRAAFRAAMDGKQVAVLVPTTILCQQHEETFRKRFDGQPVRIGALSRFQSQAESRKVLEALADGSLDVVIGTHRLLQKNVRFRDLGLLVVDEEHRFGVAHKERIKQWKKTVDVLTLTATPIPRTLQQAFAGLRDLSVIDTPPADRLAIRTQVCRFSEPIVREAILREMRRGGQVFYVHNRVQTIPSAQETLARVVPEAKLIVAHGQMPERELEARMLRFMHGEADVLLCTTIIESGLDNPRANTILIQRADALGLAQLYQLRGRVGRSNHRAYAYLLVPSPDNLSPDARKRLEAIQDLSELGSGFRLANLDLEIRGAGNLLGAEQSGNLAAVGYDTYMEMLEQTIDELRGVARDEEVDPEIRLPVPARLPESYVDSVAQRLVLYKRLSACRDDAEVDRIRDEILDRYGPLPLEAESLLQVIRLKIQARRLGVACIDLANGEFVLTAAPQTKVDPERLLRLMTQAGSGMRVTPGHQILAPAPGAADAPRLFDSARSLLAQLGA
ncbi:MAG TPA: transcription-repair coupling factor [Myxococcota bacterium]|nr:transcription-repair coupling factor [Myxococcota bacterium]